MNSQNDYPPPYSIAIGLPPSYKTETLPSYSAVVAANSATDSTIVVRPEPLIDCHQKRCHCLETLCKKLSDHKLATALALFCILLSSISIAALIIGAQRRWECPANPMVPVWLIVFGVTGIIWCWSISFLIIVCTLCDRSPRAYVRCLLIIIIILFTVFFIAWAITGLVWTREVRNARNSSCDSTVYQFAFGLSIVLMALIASPGGSSQTKST